MARPQKFGLDYFPFDVSFFSDRKIKVLMSRKGPMGVMVYLYLLCEVYRDKGYYLPADDLFLETIAAELRCPVADLLQLLDFLAQWQLIDRDLWHRSRIITSPGIQSRYQRAKENAGRKKPVPVDLALWMLEPEDTLPYIHLKNLSGTPAAQMPHGEPLSSTTLDTRPPAAADGQPQETETEKRLPPTNPTGASPAPTASSPAPSPLPPTGAPPPTGSSDVPAAPSPSKPPPATQERPGADRPLFFDEKLHNATNKTSFPSKSPCDMVNLSADKKHCPPVENSDGIYPQRKEKEKKEKEKGGANSSPPPPSPEEAELFQRIQQEFSPLPAHYQRELHRFLQQGATPALIDYALEEARRKQKPYPYLTAIVRQRLAEGRLEPDTLPSPKRSRTDITYDLEEFERWGFHVPKLP